MRTTAFLNRVLLMYLLTTCHYVLVLCPHPTVSAQRVRLDSKGLCGPEKSSGSASVVKIMRNKSQIMSKAEKMCQKKWQAHSSHTDVSGMH